MDKNVQFPLADKDARLLYREPPESPIAPSPSRSLSIEENLSILMPPPPGPPSAIPPHLAQSLASFSFISPSKEGEVSMEFSPAAKRHIESELAAKDILKPYPSLSSLVCEKPVKKSNSPEFENKCPDGQENENSTEMHPSEIFSKSPGSPSSEFKAMLDAIDVKESPTRAAKEEDFIKRQEKPNLRRCRSLEMRKRLFDMSNTPPNAFKPVFKRPATADQEDQNYTRLAKRPRDLMLGSIKESGSLEMLCKPKDTPQASSSSCNVKQDTVDHERIKVAVDALQSPEMIGDCSREHSLPVIVGKHSDLKNINHDTLANLLSHGAHGKFDKMTVIDCRYPYEYDGGHIKSAVNFYTEGQIDKFLQAELLEVTGKKPQNHILVFHCEFSSQRGPGMLRYLRKKDRMMNIHHYPKLTFPEIYVLHLGYKEFFHNHPHLCEPPAYVPMADESYIDDLKHFRAKAKSWTAGERTRSSRR